MVIKTLGFNRKQKYKMPKMDDILVDSKRAIHGNSSKFLLSKRLAISCNLLNALTLYDVAKLTAIFEQKRHHKRCSIGFYIIKDLSNTIDFKG